jgi:hypothetical protein
VRAFRRDLNVLPSRGVWRMFAITVAHTSGRWTARGARFCRRARTRRRPLEADGRVAQPYRLKAITTCSWTSFRIRAAHNGTSSSSWSELARAWASADALPPSIFIVGDRKHSIYGFRDAEVGLLEEAAQFVGGLRGGEDAQRAISVSFRSAPPLLAFVNDVFTAVQAGEPASGRRPYAFRYDDRDR